MHFVVSANVPFYIKKCMTESFILGNTEIHFNHIVFLDIECSHSFPVELTDVFAMDLVYTWWFGDARSQKISS